MKGWRLFLANYHDNCITGWIRRYTPSICCVRSRKVDILYSHKLIKIRAFYQRPLCIPYACCFETGGLRPVRYVL